MKKINDLLNKLQEMEPARRLLLERGEIRVGPEDGSSGDRRKEQLRRLFEKTNPRKNS